MTAVIVAAVVLALGCTWIAAADSGSGAFASSGSYGASAQGDTSSVGASTSDGSGDSTSSTSDSSSDVNTDSPTVDPSSSPLTPDSVEASASLPQARNSCTGSPISYRVQNLFDADDNTGWGVHGDAVGTTVRVTLPAGSTVTGVGLLPGYAKVGPRGDAGCADASAWPHNRRVTSVTWSFDNGTSVDQTFTDDQSMQVMSVDPVETTTVTMTINGSTGDSGAVDDTVASAMQIFGY